MTSSYDPDPPARTPLLVLAAFVLAGWVVLVFGPELVSLLPRSPEQQAVAAVVERAINANQASFVPPSRDGTGHVTAETIASMHARVREVAAKLFVEPYHDTWIEMMDAAIDLPASVDLVFGGGAYDFGRWHIGIDGDRATAQFRCHVFLETAQTVDGPHSRADNIVDLDVTLVRIDGAWLVASESEEFAPGGGP